MTSSNKPAVSIIIPVYNLEKYLSRCIDSVINQTLRNIEIICINDGSTDRSLDILKDYATDDPRIRIIDKEKGGPGIARNIGIDEAVGEYIGFVDGDDWIEAEMHEKMHTAAKKNISDIHICTIKMMDADGKPIMLKCDYDKYLGEKYTDDSIVFNRHHISEELFKVSRHAWNKIYKHSFLKKHNIRFLPNKYYEDNIFFFMAFFKAERISITRNQFYNYYFKREGSASSNRHMPLSLCQVNQEIKCYIDTHHVEKEFAQRFDAYNIRRCASYYYRIHKTYRKPFFDKMRTGFQKIDMKGNPFLDARKRFFCFSVKTVPYSLFRYTNLPVYLFLYIYAKFMKKHNLDL
ncbi:MAG: glycosyltransferase [Sedimentisphaerales bacterium]|nr:glycosyltransferase [Sedimentisphaerales bacterium]